MDFTGTAEERGLVAWANEMNLNFDAEDNNGEREPNTFDFPYGMGLLKR